MIQNTSHFSEPANKDFPYSAKGRFGRLSYLAWLFITSVLYSCALLIVMLLGIITYATYGATMTDIGDFLSTALGIITAVLFVVVIISAAVLSIIVSIRRIHDLNKSGWLCLLFLIPIVNVIFGIYMMLAPGTQGENNYGPPRITEQTEKLIGILYCVFLATTFMFYAGFMTFATAFSSQFAELQQHTLIEDSTQSDSDSTQYQINEEETEHAASQPTV